MKIFKLSYTIMHCIAKSTASFKNTFRNIIELPEFLFAQVSIQAHFFFYTVAMAKPNFKTTVLQENNIPYPLILQQTEINPQQSIQPIAYMFTLSKIT